jgi:hypothetical protein
MPRLGFKLGKDRVAEGLRGNAGAIRNKKYGALGHEGKRCGVSRRQAGGRARPARPQTAHLRTYNRDNLAYFQAGSVFQNTNNRKRARNATRARLVPAGHAQVFNFGASYD